MQACRLDTLCAYGMLNPRYSSGGHHAPPSSCACPMMHDGRWLQGHEAAKALLLERLVAETSQHVRRALADAIAVVARLALKRGQWAGLLDFLGQCAQSADAGQREVALVLFGALAESVRELQHACTRTAHCCIQAILFGGGAGQPWLTCCAFHKAGETSLRAAYTCGVAPPASSTNACDAVHCLLLARAQG